MNTTELFGLARCPFDHAPLELVIVPIAKQDVGAGWVPLREYVVQRCQHCQRLRDCREVLP